MKTNSVSLSRFARMFALVAMALMSLAAVRTAAASAPGGFLENDDTSTLRAMLTPSQIAAFMPAGRGSFTFPAPYNTQGVRITQPSDCGGQDCVDMIYSYWRNMSNSAGSNTMYIFAGLDKSRGGAGPTLFSYDKPSGALTDMGPLFAASSPLSWGTGEGWFFSYSMPTKLYIPQGSQMLRYDVLSHTQETVFDTTTQYPNTVIVQAYASNDDNVFSATLEDATTYATLGCVAYNASSRQFYFFPNMTTSMNECQVDKSGRYVLILEQTPQTCASCDLDTVVEDLQTGQQQILLKQNGGGSHYATGYGSEIEADAWSVPNAWRYWDMSQPLTQGLSLATGGLTQGGLLHQDLDWNVFEPSHVSWENAVPSTTTPINQQYACGGGYPSTVNAPHVNEITCFLLDDSVPSAAEQVLVVAPTMTDMNATGGNATCPGCEGYAKDPKGNIDPTGQYFFYTSNLGGSRMDAIMVKIPSQLLTGGSGSTPTPPTVSISSPTTGSTVSGTVNVAANATDGTGISKVQFLLDGANMGSAVTQSPYSVSWDTSAASTGSHTLTAVATDTTGLSTTSSPVSVSIAANVNPPAITAVSAAVTGSSSATITWTTDQASSTQVQFGTTSSYGLTTTLIPTLVTAHSAALSGLAASTTYHYQVVSSNSAGQQTVSPDMTFTTQAGSSATLPNPVAYWNLNAGSGTTAADNSGDGHTATLVNSPAWTAGVAGDGLAFNGSSSYATVPSATALNGYPLTVSVWVKSTATNGLSAIVNKYAPSSMNGYQVFMNNGNLCAWYFKDSADYIWDGSSCTLSTSGYADGNWHMVTFTVDATGGKLYVDGVQKASRAWTGVAGATTTSKVLSFARYPGVAAPYFAATLDDIRVYNKSLSASQVSALYNAMPLVVPVSWANLANLTATGGSLVKSSGCDGCEDATANSQQQIASSGYLQFTASETNTLRAVGLTNVNAGIGIVNMNYAIRLQSGDASVYENGIYKTDVTFVSGDIFKIAVHAGVVTYYLNGNVIYTSSTAPTYPLQASVSVFDVGGTVTNAVISTH